MHEMLALELHACVTGPVLSDNLTTCVGDNAIDNADHLTSPMTGDMNNHMLLVRTFSDCRKMSGNVVKHSVVPVVIQVGTNRRHRLYAYGILHGCRHLLMRVSNLFENSVAYRFVRSTVMNTVITRDYLFSFPEVFCRCSITGVIIQSESISLAVILQHKHTLVMVISHSLGQAFQT